MFEHPATVYVDHSSCCDVFIENIGQYVKYIIKIRKNSFPDNIMLVCQKRI